MSTKWFRNLNHGFALARTERHCPVLKTTTRMRAARPDTTRETWLLYALCVVGLSCGASEDMAPTGTGTDVSSGPAASVGSEGNAAAAGAAPPTVDEQPSERVDALESGPRPGWIVVDATGQGQCVPECMSYSSPSGEGANEDAGDFASENDAPCVIPNTATAATITDCTTGSRIPEDISRPGVAILNPSGELGCIATCTLFTSPTQAGADDDGLGDDWAYENEASCVISGTATAANDPCLTGEAVSPPLPRPGVYLNSDPILDRCAETRCFPFCTFYDTVVPRPPELSALESNPGDFGWENNTTCVIPGSDAATTVAINPGEVDILALYTPLGAAPRPAPRSCMANVSPPNFMAPPALGGTPLRDRFQTEGTQLVDPYGEPFVIRGMNLGSGWYDVCGQYVAFQAMDNIAALGVNAVRLTWAFESIQPVGEPLKEIVGTSPALLAEILYHTVSLGMIPILASNDTTGQINPTGVRSPAQIAEFLTEPGYLEVLDAYKAYLLVGIANEWNGAGADYVAGYAGAIDTLRAAGVENTLVVNANGYGQNCQTLLDDADTLLQGDPLGNILFDLHLYANVQVGATNGNTPQFVQNCLNGVAAANLPVMVGEFAQFHGATLTPVAWEAIMDTAVANGQGYAGWQWFGDTEYSYLHLATSWEGTLTAWGQDFVARMGTPIKASLFDHVVPAQ